MTKSGFCQLRSSFVFILLLHLLVLGVTGCGQADDSSLSGPRPAVLEALKESERLLNAGQWKDSEAILKKQLVRLSPLSPLEKWEKHHFSARYFLHYNRNLDSASSHIKFMAEIGNRFKMPAANLAAMLFCEGDYYFAQRKYERAFRNYHKGELFVSGNLSPCNQAPFVHHLGLVRYHQRDYTMATGLIKKALLYNGKCAGRALSLPDFAIRQGALNTLTLSYLKRGMLDSAVFYGEQAKELIAQHGKLNPKDSVFHAVAMGVVLGNLGEVQAAKGSYRDAEHSLRESILLNDRPGYAVEDAQGTKLKLVALHLKQGNPAKAELVLAGVGEKLESVNVPPAQKKRLEAAVFRLRSQISAMTGDMVKAYEMSESYHGLKDSIVQADLELFGTDLDLVFDSIDRENRMAMADRDSRLKNVYLIGTVLAIIFSTVFILYILRILVRSKANVSKLNRLNLQLSETVSELRLMQQENQALLKVVTHDLRNPVGGINTIIGLMLDEPGRTADDQETLGVIKSSGEVALSLIEKLLEANPEVSMSCTEVRLDLVLAECIALFDYKATTKGQHIGHQLIVANVYANRSELVRVVSNLLANAIKFSPFGAGIFVSMQLSDQGVEVVVRDHGAGVSAEKRKTIFDIYSGPGELGTDGEKSFGIGLSISKKILRAYNGKIGFRDAEGQGTEFFFVLPLI